MNATATNQYNITVEPAGPARVKVSIAVPVETIDSKLTSAVGMLKQQVQLPGFRKGKIPQHILEKRFGDSIRQEARNELIAEAWNQAREEHDLKPLGDPEPVGDPAELTLESGKPLEFAVEVEVMPTFELPEFDAIELQKPIVEVTDEHIEEEVVRQTIRHGNLEDVEGGAEEGDSLIGPASVILNDGDETFFKTEQTRISVPASDGSGQVLGVHIEDLGKLVTGAKVGDEIVITTTGPEEHELEEVRGSKVEITFNVVQSVRVKPLTNEELYKLFGLENEDALKEQLKLALELRRDQDQASVLRKQAVDKVSALVEMELPEKTTAMQAERDLQRMRTELQSSGKLSLDEVEAEVAKARSGSTEQSKERLKNFFILAKLAEHFHVTVGEHEVNARIAEIAMQNGMRPEEMRSRLAEQGQLPQIQIVVKEDKAADQLVAACTVKEVPLEEWQASQGIEGGPTPKKTKKKSSKKTASKKKTKKKTTKKSTKKSAEKS